MTNEARIEMRTKSRRLRGLLNLLSDDIKHVNNDAENYDLLCLEESLRDMKQTLYLFSEEVSDMDYVLNVSKRHRSRNLQPPL